MEAIVPVNNRLPVHIVEDHDEALPLMYRAIGAKHLPFSGITMIHFDAHPDLLSPDIAADELLNTQLLYSQTSIADWILPAIYIGHISCMVWMKSSWCFQIPEGRHQLIVGKDKISSHIRVGTPLSYFISELLYLPVSELENTRTIPLLVFTVHPQQSLHTNEPEGGTIMRELIPPLAKRSKREDSPHVANDCTVVNKTPCGPTKPMVETGCGRTNYSELDETAEELAVIIKNSSDWILDIDLDFFSTGNPFKSQYTTEQYDLLSRLYKLTELNDHEVCLQRRRKQLEQLKTLWTSEIADLTAVTSTMGLSKHDVVLVQEMRSLIGIIHNNTFVDAEYLHVSGILTDLPVHFSSQDEIERLVVAVFELLKRVANKRPALATIARSTEDEYTPPSQVELIQDLVTMAMKQGYNHGGTIVELKHHYLTRGSSNWVYESPADICDCTYL